MVEVKIMDCLNCQNCIVEYAEPCECKKYDDMTEEETEKYWTNAEAGCPYFKSEN